MSASKRVRHSLYGTGDPIMLEPGTLFQFTGTEMSLPTYNSSDSDIIDDCVGYIMPDDIVVVVSAYECYHAGSPIAWHKIMSKDIVGWVKHLYPDSTNIISEQHV